MNKEMKDAEALPLVAIAAVALPRRRQTTVAGTTTTVESDVTTRQDR